MSTVDLTANSFEETLNAEGIVLVDWWASWCGPCLQFAPVFEEAAERHLDVVFAKIDTEAEQELAAAVGISSIPTLMLFRDGVLLYAQPGAIPGEAIDHIINEARELDMDEVRREIEEADAADGL